MHEESAESLALGDWCTVECRTPKFRAKYAVKQKPGCNLPFKSAHSRDRMHGGKRAIRLHHHVRPQPAYIAAATFAIKRIRDQSKTLEQFQFQVDRSGPARDSVGSARRDEIIEILETSNQPGGLEMKCASTRFPVESRFHNDVGMQIWNRRVCCCTPRVRGPAGQCFPIAEP